MELDVVFRYVVPHSFEQHLGQGVCFLDAKPHAVKNGLNGAGRLVTWGDDALAVPRRSP